MAATPDSPADLLLREARRLRFRDAALERRFRDEQIADGLVRARVMTIVALLYVGWNGLAQRTPPTGMWPEYANWDLTVRFFIVAPVWMVQLISTFLRGRRPWRPGLYAAVTAWAAGALVLKGWWQVIGMHFPAPGIGAVMSGDFNSVILVSVIALAMPWKHAAFAALVGGLPVNLWAYTQLDPDGQRITHMAMEAVLMTCALVTVLAWMRERSERMLFAQRVSLARVNAELEQSRAELAAANAEQAAFMGIAAHDLRAPLATVRGYADLLGSGRLQDEAAQGKALGQIQEQSARMLALVSDYLGAHAAQGRAEPAQLARVDLAAAAQAAARRHAVAATAKRQRLAGPTAGDAAWVRADEARLAQVVDNFVVNALKFSPPETAVTLAVEPRGAAVRLAVSDQGPGIAAEEQAGLFKMFGRGSARPTGGEASHGLGLAVAKRLAESMGGVVGVTSEPGRGATFWIDLPAGANGGDA